MKTLVNYASLCKITGDRMMRKRNVRDSVTFVNNGQSQSASVLYATHYEDKSEGGVVYLLETPDERNHIVVVHYMYEPDDSIPYQIKALELNDEARRLAIEHNADLTFTGYEQGGTMAMLSVHDCCQTLTFAKPNETRHIINPEQNPICAYVFDPKAGLAAWVESALPHHGINIYISYHERWGRDSIKKDTHDQSQFGTVFLIPTENTGSMSYINAAINAGTQPEKYTPPVQNSHYRISVCGFAPGAINNGTIDTMNVTGGVILSDSSARSGLSSYARMAASGIGSSVQMSASSDARTADIRVQGFAPGSINKGRIGSLEIAAFGVSVRPRKEQPQSGEQDPLNFYIPK